VMRFSGLVRSGHRGQVEYGQASITHSDSEADCRATQLAATAARFCFGCRERARSDGPQVRG